MPVRKPIPMNRLKIVGENKKIAADASYQSPSGKTVRLSADGNALAARTKLLEPTLPAAESARTEPFRYTDHLRKTDTVSCVLALREAGETGEILALNFANAHIAGGGYLLGGDAQEESLCRCSLLYASIASQNGFYRWHHLHPTPLYSDKMIYSPDVPVIRSADGVLLETPQICSFLTSPAVNRRLARPWISNEKINAAMQQRTAKIIAAAAEIKPAVLVLGAYGCGVFGNRREDVLPMFEDAIMKYLPPEVAVVFAIP